jgi:hypothetical protein
MAVRYAGDAEIRVVWDERHRLYTGTVRTPTKYYAGSVTRWFWSGDARSPESYDRAASQLLKNSGIPGKVSREFVAPCPCDAIDERRDRSRRRRGRRS